MLKWLGAAILLTLMIAPPVARADHFAVTLEVSAKSGKQSADMQNDPPKDKTIVKRPVMRGSDGEQFAAAWKVTGKSATEMKDVLVHFYVVKIDRAGQAPPPLEPKRVVTESALTMDFPAEHAASARMPFRVPGPGVYLVRIETQGTAAAKGHECYAALDLIVK